MVLFFQAKIEKEGKNLHSKDILIMLTRRLVQKRELNKFISRAHATAI